MLTLSAGLTAEKNKTATTPINLFTIDFGGDVGIRRYADHDLTGPGGQPYAGLVTRWPDVDRLVLASRGLEGAAVGDARFTLVNIPVDGDRVSDLFATVLPESALCTLYQWFAGRPSSDLVIVWAGYLARSKDSITFDDGEIGFDVGTLLDRFDRTIGDLLSEGEFPNADPDALGRVQPEPFGHVDDLTCLTIDAGAQSTIRNACLASELVIEISDATRFTAFPMTVQIEDEQLTLSGKSGNDLTVSARGVNGTRATAHDYGMTVWELQSQYDYLLARRPIAAVRAVRVDGILQPSDGSVYTAYPGGNGIDYGGRPFLRFHVLPVLRKAVNIAVDQEHSHATLIDVQPDVTGAVTQQPVMTASQDGHIHDLSRPFSSVVQVGQGAAFPVAVQNAAYGWSFPQIPEAIQTTYTIDCDINTLGGGRIVFTCGGVVQTFVSGGIVPLHYQVTHPGDSTPSVAIGAYSGAYIHVTNVSRQVQFQQSLSTAAPAVQMVRAWDAVAHAWRIVDAASSTDRVGATALGGNSTADVVVGGRVSADIDGYADDSAGSYTGTPGALVTRPDHVRRWALAICAGMPTTLIDAGTFAAAGGMYASLGYSFNGAITEQITLKDLIQRWDRESRSVTTWDRGAVRLRVRQSLDTASPQKSIDRVTMRPDTFGTGRPVQIARTPIRDLFNVATALYVRDYTQGQVSFRTQRNDQVDVLASAGFTQSLTLRREESVAAYGERPKSDPFLFFFVTDPAMASGVLGFWLDQYQWIREAVRFESYLTEMELEPGDVVTLTYPGLSGIGANKGEVTEIDPRPGSSGRPDALRIEVLLFFRRSSRLRLAEATRLLDTLILSMGMAHHGQEATTILESLAVTPTVVLTESTAISGALSLLTAYRMTLIETTGPAESIIGGLQAALSEGTVVSEALAQFMVNQPRTLGFGYLGVDPLAAASEDRLAFLTEAVLVAEALAFQWQAAMAGSAEASTIGETSSVGVWSGALGLYGLGTTRLGGELS